MVTTIPQGTVAIITGAAGGLGRSTALRLAQAGIAVACSDIDLAETRKTAQLAADRGTPSLATRVDVTDASTIRAWREEVHQTLGRPSLVLNIAGSLDRRMMDDLDEPGFLRSLAINAGGPYSVIRTFADDLREAGNNGRVVNVASIAAQTGYPYPGYAASKAALLNLTRTLLLDFWGSGVTVNAVCPGAMDTPMLKREALPGMIAKTPTGRIASPNDVAAAIEFLCSESAACINGTCLVVDGGATSVFRYFEE